MCLHSTSDNWQDQLTSLDLWFDHMLFERGYACFAQRFSNHHTPKFDDAQLLAAHFFARAQGLISRRSFWSFISKFMCDWFPLLPTYSGYIDRLNRLDSLLPSLIGTLLDAPDVDPAQVSLVMDSCPIVMVGAKRAKRAKVAPHLQGCGYCAARQMYYGGLKLHVVAVRRPGRMPQPVTMSLSPANHSDIEALRQIQEALSHGALYADKAYASKDLREELNAQGCILLTPRKKHKGRFHFPGYEVKSRDISRKRQPMVCVANGCTKSIVCPLSSRCAFLCVELHFAWASHPFCSFSLTPDSRSKVYPDKFRSWLVRISVWTASTWPSN